MFTITTLPTSLSFDGTLTFTITPDAAVTGNHEVRWSIIGSGLYASAVDEFSATSGTVSFSDGSSDAQTVTVRLAGRSASYDKSFALSIDTVAPDGTTTSLASAHMVTVTSDNHVPATAISALSSSAQSDQIVLGSSLKPATDVSAGNGDDSYIITRYQFHDVTIDDVLGTNLVKLDLDVFVTGVTQTTSNGNNHATSVALTLATGAVITVKSPAQLSYQLGDGKVLSYSDFYATISASGFSDTQGTLTQAYDVGRAPVIEASSVATGTGFTITGLSETATEGSDYTITLTPDSALSSDMTIRWDVVGTGRLPTNPSDFSSLTGTVSFASGALAAQSITLPILDDSNYEYDKSFYLSLTKVLSDGTEESLVSHYLVTLQSEDSGSLASVTLEASTQDDVLTTGSSYDYAGDMSGGRGNDIFIINRHQLADIAIQDTLGENIVKFDKGVFITAVEQQAITGAGNSSLTTSVTLTLGTGAKVVVKWPVVLSFQLGDNASTSYTDFYATITAGGFESGTSGALNTAVFVSYGLAITTSGALRFDENTTFTGNVTTLYQAMANDENARFALKAGGDAALFSIDATTGKVTFNDTTTLDHETKTSYAFTIVATSSDLSTTEKAVIVIVTDLNDEAPSINSNASGAALIDNTEVASGTVIYTASGTYDLTPITWSLKDNDAGLFDIASNGVVTFKQATTPDHESGKTSYGFTVVATSGDLSSEKAVTIAVTDVNDNAPVITSSARGTALLDNTEVSDSTAVYQATGTPDVDGGNIAWSLEDNDAGLFGIDSNGVVTFNQATTPDHESGKTSYAFTVVATSGDLSSKQAVTIAVTDVNDVAPVITSSEHGTALLDNSEVSASTAVYNAIGTPDVDGGNITWSLEDNDAGLFGIDSNGVVTFNQATTPDHESGKTSYAFTVVATSGDLSSKQAVTIAVTDVNDVAPTITSANRGADLFELSDYQIDEVIYQATGTYDVVPISWSLSGSDASLFKISDEGSVTFSNVTRVPTFAEKRSYQFTVEAKSGDLTVATKDVTINNTQIFTSNAVGATLRESQNYDYLQTIYESTHNAAIQNVRWSLGKDDGFDSNLFYIYDRSGIVNFFEDTTSRHEDKSQYKFSLIARYFGRTSTQIITLNILNILNTIEGNAGDNVIDGADNVNDGTGRRDELLGLAGNDILRGLLAADRIDGGAGSDTASYAGSNAAVQIDLSSPKNKDGFIIAKGGHAEGDELKNVENLIGSNHNDDLTGDSGANKIEGGAGADMLAGGEGDDELVGGVGNDTFIGDAGADVIDGGDGIDTVSYILSVSGVTIDLNSTPDNDGFVQGQGGYAAGDKLKNIENLIGSAHADVLAGNDVANDIKGGAGNDRITGHDGDDTLSGEEGDDSIYGGDNNDTLTGGGGNDTIEGGSGADRIEGGAGNDTLEGGSGADTIKGEADDDTIDGGSGNDTIEGGAGNDIIKGGRGHDTIRAGDGNDIVEGGPGGDDMDGGAGNDTLSYEGSTFQGVVVELSATAINYSGDAWQDNQNRDVVRNFENLIGSRFVDSLIGNDQNNVIKGGAAGDTIDGKGGNDTASYAGSSAAVQVDLSSSRNFGGFFTAFGGHAAGDKIKNIENIKGSDHNDTLTGDGNSNILIGAKGADTLDGKGGNDTASYEDSDKGISINLGGVEDGNGFVAGKEGHAEGDKLKNIETIIGSHFDDTLEGSRSSDTLIAGTGDDELIGSSGADKLDGGDGIDSLAYVNSDLGVTVNLGGSKDSSGYITAASGYANGDKIKNIENLIGSAHNDTLTGDSKANLIIGGQGQDTMDGAGGVDTASFANSNAGVTLTLNGSRFATAAGGHAEGDKLKNIENIIGSKHNDAIIGDDRANYIFGGDGDDSIGGGKGNDYLQGGFGHNYIDGGDGNDTISFADLNDLNPDFFDFLEFDLNSPVNKGEVSTSYRHVTLYGTQKLSFRNIENIKGTDHSYNIIYGDWMNNVIEGGGYADTLFGRVGKDTLYGYDGDDLLDGDIDDDHLYGGVGADILDGGAHYDIIYYTGSDAAVTIDLSGQKFEDFTHFSGGGYIKAAGGHAQGDLIKNIEEIVGSSHNDFLKGGDYDITFMGKDGDDTLVGGSGDDTLIGGDGADTMDGGLGRDTVSYRTSTAGITVDLTSDVDVDGYVLLSGTGVEGDRLRNIEIILGSNFDDLLTGDDADNEFYGGAGNDELRGGAGDDLLHGNGGSDTIDGGSGNDTASFADSNSALNINLGANPNAQGYIVLSGGHAEGDKIKNIENIIGTSRADTIIGNHLDNILEGGAGADVIDGKGGDNTISYYSSHGAVTVDLSTKDADGNITTSQYDARDDKVKNVVNIYGSNNPFFDRLTGDDRNNFIRDFDGTGLLVGKGGDDMFMPGIGNDVMDGGDGQDTVSYSDYRNGVNVDLSGEKDVTNFSKSQIDVVNRHTYKSIEHIIGSNYNDTLTGDSQNNTINGLDGDDVINAGGGNDFIIGGAGGDTIDGGSGFDIVSYKGSSEGVTFDLSFAQGGGALIGNGGDAKGDVLRNVEEIIGSDYDDVINGIKSAERIIGNGGADTLFGDAGNDSIEGGEGRDIIDGGAGKDTAVYSFSNAGVFVDLSGRQDSDGYFIARYGHAEGDRLKDIENITGSNYADDLTGDNNQNVIKGGDGNDYIRGGAGNDTLYSGNGDDTLIGGKGDDKIILDDGKDIVVVTFNSNATATGQWAITSGQDVIDNFHRGQDKIIFVDENDKDQSILTLNDFLYDDNSPLIRGIFHTGNTYPTLETIVIEFQGNNQNLTINIARGSRYQLPRFDEEQPTDANNGFLLKSYASFAPFIGGTDAVEFYEIDNLPANVDLL